MKDVYNIIYDWDEVHKFYGMLPKLKNDEIYFVSLSCRNKYLSNKDREYYGLSRAEMFAKSIIRNSDWNKFVNILSRFECDKKSYTTKNGKPYPQESIVCYFSINPKSQFKAFNDFKSKINNITFEHMTAMMKNQHVENDSINNKLRRLDVEYMNSLVKSDSVKNFIDIDFDIDKNDTTLYNDFIDYLKKSKISYIAIETKGGFHVLMYRKTINKNTEYKFNFYQKVVEIDKKAKSINPKFEIIKNDNGMIPMPGTLQGGFKVKIKEFRLIIEDIEV